MSLPRAGSQLRKHRYSVYGLVLESTDEIVGLREARHSDDATIELRAADAELLSRARSEIREKETSRDHEWFLHASLTDGSDYLRWTNHFEFLVDREGHQINWIAAPGGSPEALQTYVLGQVLSFALLKRGIEPLHATAVCLGESAVAFVGESGAGKSTLAASFLAAGYPLLTDDLLVLKQHDEALLGFPGMPRIKLYPEVLTTFLPESPDGVAMNQWTPKRIVHLSATQFRDRPMPLSAIFLLETKETSRAAEGQSNRDSSGGESDLCSPRIENLASRDGFVELLENTYNPLVDDSGRLRRQFHCLASLVEKIPLAVLRGPRDLGRVDELRDAVIEHLSAGQ